MSTAIPIAFYAPLKAPDHPVPSGDRTMARNLLAALEDAGFAPRLASRCRTHDPVGDIARQQTLRDAAAEEARDLAARFLAAPGSERPRLWFTYHLYYKAPDWIGPAVAGALAIPYVVAEGSRAAKRREGSWRIGHSGAEAALDAASIVFVLNEADRESLEAARPDRQQLVSLPPFIGAPLATVADAAHADDAPARLLTVAMMRSGDKLASYRLLAAALPAIEGAPWTLDIVGDGPERLEVSHLFARFGHRVRLLGALAGDDLARAYAGHDLLVWPAVNEAFGMALLEAQGLGCPVVAGAYGGVAGVVRHGETGLLTPPGDVGAFARSIDDLIARPESRRRMAAAARRFVAEERSVSAAAAILGRHLLPLCEEGP